MLYLGLGKNDQNQDVSTLYYPDAAMTIGAFSVLLKRATDDLNAPRRECPTRRGLFVGEVNKH